MSESNPRESRRKLLFAGGAGLFGVAAIATGWMAKLRRRGRAAAEARRLVARLDLPQGPGGMLRAFSQDPEKVERYRELARWRKTREEEPRNA